MEIKFHCTSLHQLGTGNAKWQSCKKKEIRVGIKDLPILRTRSAPKSPQLVVGGAQASGRCAGGSKTFRLDFL